MSRAQVRSVWAAVAHATLATTAAAQSGQAPGTATQRDRPPPPPVRLELFGGRNTAVGSARLFGQGYGIGLSATFRVRPRLGVYAFHEGSSLDGRDGIGRAPDTGPSTGSGYFGFGALTPVLFGRWKPERLDLSVGASAGINRFRLDEFWIHDNPDGSGAPRPGGWYTRPLVSGLVRADVRVVRQVAVSVSSGVHATFLGRSVTGPFAAYGGGDAGPFRTMLMVPLNFGLAYRF